MSSMSGSPPTPDPYEPSPAALDNPPIAAPPHALPAAASQRARRSPFGTVARIIALLLLAWAVWWAFKGIQFDVSNFRHGVKAAADFIKEMFPRGTAGRKENWATLKEEWQPLVQTLQMDIVGTILALLIAFPLSFIAARTTSFFRPLSWGIKSVLNVGRAIPVLIYALIVVSAIGLGAPAGTVALAFGTFVMLTKLYAEALESIAPGPVEAVKASGGNAVQVFAFGMLPQVFPNFLSATLYAFEINIGASAILGIVGAGGIGFDLQNDIRLFNLTDAGVILFMLIVLVNAVDYLSFKIRQVFS